MPLLEGVDLPVDLPIWPVTIAIWNCHSWPLDASTWGGGRSASWSAYVTCNNSNLKLPFLATRCLYWGVDLPVDLPIWPVTIAIWNCHSWPLDASTGGGDLWVNLPIWPVTIAIWNCHSWPHRCLYWGVDLPVWSAYMTCNNSNLKLPVLATRCLYQGGTSASWSAYMTCNNSNLKLPFLATRYLYLGWG